MIQKQLSPLPLSSEQASFWLHNITKKLSPFHFSPKPIAEEETKRQQTKQLP